jgi:transcriptional regulator with XRE-family HTH domain
LLVVILELLPSSMLNNEKLKTLKKIVGVLIKRHRLKNGITQKELGLLLGVDKQYVWKLENGKINLTIDFLEKVILALKCSVSDFLNIDDDSIHK